jgi:hypothetical protein
VNRIGASSSIEEVAALVSGALTKAGITAVLSGGGAVQIYSRGLFVSRDLDFVSPAPTTEIAAVVSQLGFQRAGGRHFIHAESPFTLEFPPWPLAIGRVLILEWSERKEVSGVIQMLTPTQCVMDRLAAFYFWRDRQALEQAVAVSNASEIEVEVVRQWSHEEGKALEFQEFVRQLGQPR